MVLRLAKRAAATALRLRARTGRGLHSPICPYDLAVELGIEVRFVAVPSLEGIYAAGAPPLIVVNSLRPAGRRRYTCAHELGHHVFGHGSRVDELVDDASDAFDPDEYSAERFAAALLLPQAAVIGAFSARGWSVPTSSPIEIYTVAGYFGVGYATLVGYLERTLGILGGSAARALTRRSPKSIKAEIAGGEVAGDLVVIDEQWSGRPVDLEVGDLAITKQGCRTSGECLSADEAGQVPVIRAVRPGMGMVELGSRLVAVRVSRKQYVGLAEFRHLEDSDEN